MFLTYNRCAIFVPLVIYCNYYLFMSCTQAWVDGVRSMMEVIIVLLLAWGLGAAITASYTKNLRILGGSCSACN